MTEPLTIWECPLCRRVFDHHPWPNHVAVTGFCPGRLTPVRVFREEDVRPLYEAAGSGIAALAVDAFPAPKDWR